MRDRPDILKSPLWCVRTNLQGWPEIHEVYVGNRMPIESQTRLIPMLNGHPETVELAERIVAEHNATVEELRETTAEVDLAAVLAVPELIAALEKIRDRRLGVAKADGVSTDRIIADALDKARGA